MPQRLHRIECLVTPERRLILVLGEGADQASYLPDFREDRLCYAERDVMFLVSVSDYHDAEVALEAWDGPPDPMPDAELAEVVHMELRGGVFVCALFAPALTPAMPVGRPGSYAAQVSVAGRSTLINQVEAGAVDRPSGVERFRVAFWPSEG